MQTRITTGTFMALACSLVLAYAAPQQRPGAGAPPGAGVGRAHDAQTTTMTGCVREGSSPHSFVLMQSPGTSVPNGGVGTVGGRQETFELVSDGKTDFSKMVGRRVEVTGVRTIGPGGSAGHPGASTPAPEDQGFEQSRATDHSGIGGGTGDRERAAGDAGLRRFAVKTIKATGPSC